MDTFLIIVGIIILLIGIGVLLISEGDDGLGALIGGIVIVAFGLICKAIPDKKGDVKKDSQTIVDSTQIKIPKDSIYSVQFIISWKDANEIKCGQNVILKGKTEKSIGDTITINLPN